MTDIMVVPLKDINWLAHVCLCKRCHVANLNLIAAANVDQLWTHDQPIDSFAFAVGDARTTWMVANLQKNLSKHEHDAGGP